MVTEVPIVRALANMTAERIKTMSDALFRIAMTFLTKNCPQKPAKMDTDMRYRAAVCNTSLLQSYTIRWIL